MKHKETMLIIVLFHAVSSIFKITTTDAMFLFIIILPKKANQEVIIWRRFPSLNENYSHWSFWSFSRIVPRSGTAVADFDLCLSRSRFFARFRDCAFSFSPVDSIKTFLSKSFNWSSVDGSGKPSFSSVIKRTNLQFKNFEILVVFFFFDFRGILLLSFPLFWGEFLCQNSLLLFKGFYIKYWNSLESFLFLATCQPYIHW